MPRRPVAEKVTVGNEVFGLMGHDRQKSPNSEGGLYVGQPRHAAGFVIRYSIIHFPNDREMQINEVARVEMINSTELSE